MQNGSASMLPFRIVKGILYGLSKFYVLYFLTLFCPFCFLVKTLRNAGFHKIYYNCFDFTFALSEINYKKFISDSA